MHDADTWLGNKGFTDRLQWYNDLGESLWQLLWEDETYGDDPIFALAAVCEFDEFGPGVPSDFDAFVFEDDSVIVNLGDRWVEFGPGWINEDCGYLIDDVDYL